MKRLALVLLIASIAGCSDASGPGADPAPGVYALRTVNGSSLPYVFSRQGEFFYEILNDTYSLNVDGTYSEQVTGRTSGPGLVLTVQAWETGIWNRNGTAITFRVTAASNASPGETYVAGLGGSSLTFTGTQVFVYRK